MTAHSFGMALRPPAPPPGSVGFISWRPRGPGAADDDGNTRSWSPGISRGRANVRARPAAAELLNLDNGPLASLRQDSKPQPRFCRAPGCRRTAEHYGRPMAANGDGGRHEYPNVRRRRQICSESSTRHFFAIPRRGCGIPRYNMGHRDPGGDAARLAPTTGSTASAPAHRLTAPTTQRALSRPAVARNCARGASRSNIPLPRGAGWSSTAEPGSLDGGDRTSSRAD